MFPLFTFYFLLGVGTKSCFILDRWIRVVETVSSMSHFEKQKDLISMINSAYKITCLFYTLIRNPWNIFLRVGSK